MPFATVEVVENEIVVRVEGSDLLEPLVSATSDARDEAVAAAATAETARDVALTAGPYYPSIAAGEAAVAMGADFAVATGDGTVKWYRKGAPTVEIFEPATTAALADEGGADRVGIAGGGTVQDFLDGRKGALDAVPVVERAAIISGTSTYNSGPAIQASINAVNLLSGGDLTIRGRMLATTALTIDRPVDTTTGGLTIHGHGDGAAIVLPNAAFTLFDSSLAVGANPLSETLHLRDIAFVGTNTAAAAYVRSKDFLRDTYENVRFEKVKLVDTPIYLQSTRLLNCEAWRWTGTFAKATGAMFDLSIDNMRFEAGGAGIEAGALIGSRIVNSLYEGSTGPFLKTAGFSGLLVAGNYTEGNAGKDYVFTDIASFGAGFGGALVGNAMLVPASGFTVDIGDVRGMFSAGNYCAGDMFNVTNTRTGQFTSIGDYSAGTKFSDDRFWEATADGLERMATGLTATPAGGQATALVLKKPFNVITVATKSGAANASVALPPTDDLPYGDIGKYVYVVNEHATNAIDVFHSQADRTNFGSPTAAIGTVGPGQYRKFVAIGQGKWRPDRTIDAAWTLATGIENKGAFATYTAPTVSAAYTQAEVQALADALQAASRRIFTLELAMREGRVPA